MAVVRTSITRIIATTMAVAALVGVLVLGAAGQLSLRAAFGALGIVKQADYVHGGVRIVPPAPTSLTPEGDENDDSETLVGDDVDSALATYGIDGDGNLFEEHSPQTEVPRLGGPTI
jgi:hypothetical protein